MADQGHPATDGREQRARQAREGTVSLMRTAAKGVLFLFLFGAFIAGGIAPWFGNGITTGGALGVDAGVLLIGALAVGLWLDS